MTNEQKQILLIDLCARLPYGVKVKSQTSHLEINTVDSYFVDGDDRKMFHLSEPDFWQTVDDFQYYLRPISSMTEEEYKSVSWKDCSHTYNYSLKSGFRFIEIKTFTINILNWLNAHHFDYRGLISMGLALEAPEDMYKEE